MNDSVGMHEHPTSYIVRRVTVDVFLRLTDKSTSYVIGGYRKTCVATNALAGNDS